MLMQKQDGTTQCDAIFIYCMHLRRGVSSVSSVLSLFLPLPHHYTHHTAHDADGGAYCVIIILCQVKVAIKRAKKHKSELAKSEVAQDVKKH